MMKTEYRRRKKSDCWHYHPDCRWWPVMTSDPVCRTKKPTSGEFCNECMAKARRDKA